MIPPPPRSTLFPYTTLFRSGRVMTPRLTAAFICDHEFLTPTPTPSPSAPSDRKSTRLNSSHVEISYAVFCLKKKKKSQVPHTSHPCFIAVIAALPSLLLAPS